MKEEKLEIKNLPIMELVSVELNPVVGGFIPLFEPSGLLGSFFNINIGPVNKPFSVNNIYNQGGANNFIRSLSGGPEVFEDIITN